MLRYILYSGGACSMLKSAVDGEGTPEQQGCGGGEEEDMLRRAPSLLRESAVVNRSHHQHQEH